MSRERIEELEQENERLKAELALSHQQIAALKFTIVTTIGGTDYEGFPTSEINYLQRLRILLEKEKETEALSQQLASANEQITYLKERWERFTTGRLSSTGEKE